MGRRIITVIKWKLPAANASFKPWKVGCALHCGADAERVQASTQQKVLSWFQPSLSCGRLGFYS